MIHDCPICGAPVHRGKHCSYRCAGEAKKHYRECVICGTSFACPPSNGNKTCSRECASALRAQHRADGVYDVATAMMLKGKEASPILQGDEHHINAKVWVIVSPEGQVFECRNLAHWVREHADMLPGTSKQATDGIRKIKYGALGKRKKPASTWKGWRLLSWGD